MRANDRYIGVEFLWSWKRWTWSWFTSHGVQSGYTGAQYNYDFKCNHHVMVRAPDRIFDRIYHFGPLKIRFGVKAPAAEGDEG